MRGGDDWHENAVCQQTKDSVPAGDDEVASIRLKVNNNVRTSPAFPIGVDGDARGVLRIYSNEDPEQTLRVLRHLCARSCGWSYRAGSTGANTLFHQSHDDAI